MTVYLDTDSALALIGVQQLRYSASLTIMVNYLISEIFPCGTNL